MSILEPNLPRVWMEICHKNGGFGAGFVHGESKIWIFLILLLHKNWKIGDVSKWNSEMNSVYYHVCVYFVHLWLDTSISEIFWDSELQASKLCWGFTMLTGLVVSKTSQKKQRTVLHLCLLQGIIKGIPLTLPFWPLDQAISGRSRLFGHCFVEVWKVDGCFGNSSSGWHPNSLSKVQRKVASSI